jgi:hypothetical protein
MLEITQLNGENPTQLSYSLDHAIAQLQSREWINELNQAGITENREHAISILRELAEGLIDVVDAVRKRKELPRNYKLPDIKILPNYGASYTYSHDDITTDENTELSISCIVIGTEVLNRLASETKQTIFYGTVKSKKKISNFLQRIGTSEQYAHAIGTEEGAHSIFVRDRLNKNIKIEPGELKGRTAQTKITNYHASDIEYHGLGWRIRVLMDAVDKKKITPEEAEQQLEPLKNLLNRVAKLRRKQRLKT